MAGLLIQETLGKDTTAQLHTMEQCFRSLRMFTMHLLQLEPHERQPVDWESVLGSEEEGLNQMLRKEGASKGMLAL